MLDVVIVGGGPAGLNAALILGRCRRNVLLCDTGNPRNRVSHGVHGFLTRDGVKPEELRRIGREEIARYPTVEIRDIEVKDADRIEGGFEVLLEDGERLRCRKLLLATGLVEDLPDIPGFRQLFGQGVYNCPYCDGWEMRDQPIAVYGLGNSAVGFAVQMLIWSADVVLCTDGPADLTDEDKRRLDRHGIPVNERRITHLQEAKGGGLGCIMFEDGTSIERRALFYVYGEREPSPLAEKLGCELTEKGVVETRSYEKTNVPSLYAAGDASKRVQFAIVAAAEGAAAAFAINSELFHEDYP
jgi:thioredoxin reductase